MTDTNPEAPVIDEPSLSPEESAAVEAEQASLDVAILRAQVNHLVGRVAELAAENARLKA